WGDWLNFNEQTLVEFIDAVYFAKDARLMAEMAAAIGKSDEAAGYRSLRDGVVARWRADWLNADGTLKAATQTAHVLALENSLVPDELITPTTARLVARITANGGRMATGFLGTKPLLPVLSAHGHHDLAVKMFQSRQFPSWGYEVENGATSIWERWDSYTKEDGFGRHNAAMNSFSHYAFGAVCEWMFHDLAGLGQAGAGMQRLVIRPQPPAVGSNLERAPISWVRTTHDSAYGRIAVAWKRTDGVISLDLTVPPNCTAAVQVPTRDGASIRLDGQAPTATTPRDGTALTIGSGTWAVTAVAP
ncbi:MAG TPA: alpha-L-rhamnosidase C-terminal domain-containing protein, partial [Planctomycetota bacterium]|nr:alpha-L-rhamnosidase C-terminal domain-containing protein [Planctomycetota bacterium]